VIIRDIEFREQFWDVEFDNNGFVEKVWLNVSWGPFKCDLVDVTDHVATTATDYFETKWRDANADRDLEAVDRHIDDWKMKQAFGDDDDPEAA